MFGFCANLAANTVMESASLSGEKTEVCEPWKRAFLSECVCGTQNGWKAKHNDQNYFENASFALLKRTTCSMFTSFTSPDKPRITCVIFSDPVVS